MAIANFFGKAALGAAQILKGYDHDNFQAAINRQKIAVCFDKASTKSEEGKAAIELAVNLIARLYPSVAIIAGSGSDSRFVERVLASATDINPELDIQTKSGKATARVVIGKMRVPANCPTVFVGSSGWIGRVSTRNSLEVSNSSNPIGGAIGACFGTANLFRLIFKDSLPHGQVDEVASFSPVTCDGSEPETPDLVATDLGTVHLVGLGAIGNGIVWALARCRKISGELRLVDHEKIELSNLQRYVLATQTDIGKEKTGVAKAYLARSELSVFEHPCRWGEYLRKTGNWHLERVAVALDSAEDRIALQASLPRRIINAWTQPEDLGVSRHGFLEDACLACLYLPKGTVKSQDAIIADAIGMSSEVREIRELLYTGAPLNRQFVERIATSMGVEIAALLPFVGQSLQSFYSGAVCGGIILKIKGSGGEKGAAEVPMAFQSCLAGILVASELIIESAGLRSKAVPTTTRINLLRRLAPYLNFPELKHAAGNCICQDDDFIAAFRTKWKI